MRRLVSTMLLPLLLLSLAAVATVPGPVQAHSPSSVQLEYADGILNVTITHVTPTPESHYIEEVVVEVNDVVVVNETYDSQPDPIEFSYEYPVSAEPGDVITVTATCSILGETTEDLTVGGLEMSGDLSAANDQLGPGERTEVTLTLTDAEGEPLVGAVVGMTVSAGEVEQPQDHSDGTYTAWVTAPASAPATIVVTATANKENYSEFSTEATITVSDPGGDGTDGDDGADGTDGDDGGGEYQPEEDGDDGGRTPGFDGAMVLSALGALSLLSLVARRVRK